MSKKEKTITRSFRISESALLALEEYAEKLKQILAENHEQL